MRLTLNKSDEGLLKGLFGYINVSSSQAERLAALIISRRTSKSDGADSGNLQRAAQRSLGFIDVTQLNQIVSMPAHIYQKMLPFVTIFGRDGRVNALTSPQAVLSSIPDLKNDEVESILSQRIAYSQNNASRMTLNNRLLSTETGPAYILLIEVKDAGTGAKKRIEATILITQKNRKAPYRILNWRDSAIRDFKE